MQTNQSTALRGKKVAVLMTDGVEQVEYTDPRHFLEEHGADVTLLSPKAAGEDILGFNYLEPGSVFEVERDVREARPDEFDALVLPGGVANPDMLRLCQPAVKFIEEFARADKPIAAICHGPWTLIDAGVVRNKRITSWPSLQKDLRNAGAQWIDEPVVIDGKLLTSRKPADLPEFDEALLRLLSGEAAQSSKPASGDSSQKEPIERASNVQEEPGKQMSG